MDVLMFLVSAAIIGTALFWLVVGLAVAGFALFALWPSALGIGLGVLLWIGGADNLGVVFALAGIGGNVGWMLFLDKGEAGGSSYDRMSGKRAHYDKDGNITG